MRREEPMPFTSALAAARNGSGEALGEILESCRGYISTVVSRQLPRKLQGRVRPSSLVQETYLRACRHFDSFRGDSERQLLAWLKQIMLHCLLNLLRQPEFRMSVQDLPAQLAGRTEAPAQQAADRECARALEQALERLPAHYRLAIELHHFNGLTWAEIGNILGCTAEAARKLWARAQVKLGEDLRAFQ